MKPATAAKKLGIYLPASPESFQDGDITRTELASLLDEPPAWLVDLRRNGPHPRDVVAGKLGISISGLARGGITDPLTSSEITALLEAPPAWLVQERKTQADVRAEKQRVKARNAERASRK
ncbi:MAG: hypothetical protein QOF36_2357 [Microbacteriaceae bacterium]|nr:hypothetical protein [Microbacteriaceae bacterium]